MELTSSLGLLMACSVVLMNTGSFSFLMNKAEIIHKEEKKENSRDEDQRIQLNEAEIIHKEENRIIRKCF
jgi:hypothetical protein